MTKYSGGFWIIALCGIVLAAAVPAEPAMAQSKQTVLVINQAEILRDSKAGQAIVKQASERRTQFSKEVQAEQAKVKKAVQDYQKNKDVMSPDQRVQKQKQLRVLTINAQGLEIQRTRELQVAIAKGRQEIFEALKPIVQDLIDERKATMLIDRQFIVFVADDLNITAEALKRLDAKLKTIKLQKVALDQPKK